MTSFAITVRPIKKLQSSLPHFGRKFRLIHVLLITDSSSSIGILMRYSLHRILHSCFFWDEIVKQQTVTYITMSDLKTIAPITYCWTQTTATPLPSLTEVPTTALLFSRKQFLRAVGYSYTLWYTIYSNRRVSETFTAECIDFTHKVRIATCFWFWYFTCRTLFCDFGLFLCDFGDLSGYFFGNFRDKASNIILYDDMLPLVGLWLIAKWMT